ncbi:hypothetical protein GCM10007420_07240 [Glycocaulis albus]|uniref:Squalene cyclase C-terminal domain-containing protein n=1 Tax=Glycocaulis albus TaxID=1382801 RepID=A0ABQ1XI79_9PROT|nr:hypothetical protein [Glycocaulis albus]GGG94303.1 hypothetical protein GCM10007420_07240 [Glycocaulis albus]
MPETLPSIARYNAHLRITADWLLQSIQHGKGGSSAHYSHLRGWSAPYPETTGYIIPTLIDASAPLDDPSLHTSAITLGEWLLDLQDAAGWWPGGLLKPGSARQPSVFNTAQILDGMTALARNTGEARWRDAAARGASWLARNLGADGCWQIGNYREGVNPSYYAQVAWPMLQVWQLSGDDLVHEAAIRVLDRIIARRVSNGVIAGWGFDEDRPAPTHTIAYTLRGLIESALLLDRWDTYGEPCMAALEKLSRKSQIADGRLPGAYREDWSAVSWYSCLTGNVQTALCLLRVEQRERDLRLVNSAARLVDHVCSHQQTGSRPAATRGAVAGSSPPWGRYMFMRYPNWAAKYHADALMMLAARLQGEADR